MPACAGAARARRRAQAHFTPDVDLLVHALCADAVDAIRIDLEMVGPGGEVYMRLEAVPYDADAGVVYVACQRHLQGEEEVEDVRFRLTGVRPDGSRVLGEYVVRHHWNATL